MFFFWNILLFILACGVWSFAALNTSVTLYQKFCSRSLAIFSLMSCTQDCTFHLVKSTTLWPAVCMCCPDINTCGRLEWVKPYDMPYWTL